MDDESILRLYADRDEQAIALTSEKYGARLRSVSYGITADRETAEECVNDTYLEAWQRIPPDEPKTYFFAYLARITRFFSIDRCRERTSLKRGGHIVELTDELEECLSGKEDVEDAVDGKLLGETISRFLRTLPVEKQNLFLRRYFYLDSVADIGRRFGMGESRVKTALFRIRRDLRDYLVKEGYTL